jgi:hypothetical protein
MELEFDKEINAILRKAGVQNAATNVATAHIDADTIAAFAENAMPARARPPLIEHFAACDNCRQTLSQTILLNAEAGATAASSNVADTPPEISIPWWRKLFDTPGLALAMGALVLAFTGVLGYVALQSKSSGNAEVSQITEPERPRGGPYDSGELQSDVSNKASDPIAMSNSTSAVSNAMTSNKNAAAAIASNPTTTRREDAAGVKTAGLPGDSRSELDSSSSRAEEPLAGAQPPPPPPVTGGNTVGKDEKKADNDDLAERGRENELAKRKETEDRRAFRDAPMAAAKSGPARSGPLQTQSNQAGNRAFDMEVSRSVGGKTFNNRNGAWYDSAYHGQTTTDVRRGTNEFKKLDGGLKSIANNLNGVVVVIWKQKAYRIQ